MMLKGYGGYSVAKVSVGDDFLIGELQKQVRIIPKL